MKEVGQTTLMLEPELKKMLVDASKTIHVGQQKLVNRCLLHGLLDLKLNETGKVEFKR